MEARAVSNGVKPAMWAILLTFSAAAGLSLTADPQSLADAARVEAERRRLLDQQGVKAKKIEAADPAQLAPNGNIGISSPGAHAIPASAVAKKSDSRASLRTFQTSLQKLDRDIAQTEGRLKLLRARADAERWAPVKTTKGSRGSAASASQDQMRWQILDLEAKLARLKQERMDTFEAGRKAGYLPGELENRGVNK